jgi:lipoyl synthase
LIVLRPAAMRGADGGKMERRHPDWIKVRAPSSPEYFQMRALLAELKLHTVCQEACCPNIGECFGHRTATFMLMGDVCTRNCPYCAVAHGRVRPLDPDEPRRIAQAVSRLGLQHVVVTSVDRDDLHDGGAAHFAATAEAIKQAAPSTRVEVLVPDFKGSYQSVDAVVRAPVDIYNHNVETVPSLYRKCRPGGHYEVSLAVLAHAKQKAPEWGRSILTKTGIMLGLGEERDELRQVFNDLRTIDCDILTLGQYLRPSQNHLPVVRYVPPAEFADLRHEALALGFRHVESGPLVRSSYHAWDHVR